MTSFAGTRSIAVTTALTLASLALFAACDRAGLSPTDTGPPELVGSVLPGGGTPDGDGAAGFEEFELCKYGTAATFDFDVFDRNSSTTTTGQVTLQDGDCVVIAEIGGLGADVTVTEQVPAGFLLDHVDVTTLTGSVASPVSSTQSVSGPTVTEFISGSNGGGLRGILAEYYNVPAPVLEGRMTGGGSFFAGNVRFTHGFELHCDPADLPNNLEINWRGSSNAFHLTSLTSAVCTDDPAISPLPPAAPFDTYMGVGTGTLNGVPGAVITFTFTDAGEGGSSDVADISIVPPGGGTPIVASNTLQQGNHQAHPDN